jgi:hypothetical protein
MAQSITLRVDPLGVPRPVDDEGRAYFAKRKGQMVVGKFSQPRSMEQNALLWAVAEKTFENLPEKWIGVWPDKYRMIKGLQVALGITDEIAVPGRDGMEVKRLPSSIADMSNEEANAACDLLFKGMARLLGVGVDTLLAESRP